MKTPRQAWGSVKIAAMGMAERPRLHGLQIMIIIVYRSDPLVHDPKRCVIFPLAMNSLRLR